MNAIDKFLNESIILNESKCGIFNDYLVKVNSNDPGNIPHFHVVDSNTEGNNFHTCIQIKTNHYFLHEGKMDILTSSSDRKDLQKFLISKPNNIPKEIGKWKSFLKTNWLMICYLWNVGNRSKMIDISKIKMPNYTTINLER